MDYLFFCAGECTDNLRDRDLFLVKDVAAEADARNVLQSLFDVRELGEQDHDFEVLVRGENMECPEYITKHFLVGGITTVTNNEMLGF